MWASATTALNRTNIVRIPYAKYSTGANRTTCTAYRALGKPDSTAARRTFLTGRAIGEWYAEAKCFFRRDSAISRPNGLFFHIFSAMTEKIWPAERRPLCRKPHRALGAYETGLNITPTEPPRHSFSFSLSAAGRSPTAAPPLPPPARRRRSPASGCTAA